MPPASCTAACVALVVVLVVTAVAAFVALVAAVALALDAAALANARRAAETLLSNPVIEDVVSVHDEADEYAAPTEPEAAVVADALKDQAL